MGRLYEKDAALQFRYRVFLAGEILGVEYDFGGFSSVSGLSVEFEETRYAEGNDRRLQKIPGRREVGDVILRKGVVKNTPFLKDFVEQLKKETRVALVVFLMHALDPQRAFRHWVVHDAWIKRWEGPELDGSSSEVAVESVTFACEDITSGTRRQVFA